ncbi:MAG: flagellar hook-basal body complex protein FliE [candidate division Zixibacteria bacterium]|nr:flagellar hook-basal body complex protein FliE [Candidatus Tariuqbacter arcticus]
MDRISGLPQQYRDILKGMTPKGKEGADETSFKDVISQFIKDVDTMQKVSDESVKNYATGEITDIHQVMKAAEEANMSFQLMMEVRNRLVESYREIMRMQV